jgi:hypothetical protein
MTGVFTGLAAPTISISVLTPVFAIQMFPEPSIAIAC